MRGGGGEGGHRLQVVSATDIQTHIQATACFSHQAPEGKVGNIQGGEYGYVVNAYLTCSRKRWGREESTSPPPPCLMRKKRDRVRLRGEEGEYEKGKEGETEGGRERQRKKRRMM